MKKFVAMFLVLVLASAAVAENNQLFITQAFGSGTQGALRIGLRKAAATWGIEMSRDSASERADLFGLWAELETPELSILKEDQLPPFWAGLETSGFIDVSLLTDTDFDNIVIVPGVGVKLAPAEWVRLLAKTTYPIGGSASYLDLNDWNYYIGFEVVWK